MIKALNDREHDIQTALDEAKKAKEEMANLKAENEALLQQAREERKVMLAEATNTKNQIISEAKDKAKSETNKMIANARLEIQNQKNAALTEVKNQAGLLAIEVAEKVIKKELKSSGEHQSYVDKLIQDISNN